MLQNTPLHFYNESIKVEFLKPPMLEKKPECPHGFFWRDEHYVIIELLSEWVDHHRRGKMQKNMRPEHAALAETRGSWGVGRFYFRVQVEDGRIFDIYYDRAPGKAGEGKGAWYIWGERQG